MAINTIKATIQMRKGLERDFDEDQMTAGEWAVSTDKKYVRMCFAPGIVVRMATYEGFESDMEEVRIILKECQNIQTAVNAMAALAEQHKNDSASSALLSESWAHGDTGVRDGENTNNSEYHSQQSNDHAKMAKSWAIGEGDIRPNESVNCSKYFAEQAGKIVSAAFSGALVPIDTVSFEELPTAAIEKGQMYNISNDFVTDSRFEDGEGISYKAGTKVYFTANSKWSILSGVRVTGIKVGEYGDYEIGNVDVTAEKLGVVPFKTIADGSFNDVKKTGLYEMLTHFDSPLGNNIGTDYAMAVIESSTMGSSKFFQQLASPKGTNRWFVRSGGKNILTGVEQYTEWEELVRRPELSTLAFTGKMDDLDGVRNTGLVLRKGYTTSEYRGDNHPIGWACMAKIEVFDSTYIDQPIEFKISRRETEGKVINRVVLRFASQRPVDPPLKCFHLSGNPVDVENVCIGHSYGVWNLYVKERGPYDAICIHDVSYDYSYMGYIKISYPNTYHETLPGTEEISYPTYYSAASHDTKGRLIADEIDSLKTMLAWKQITELDISDGITKDVSCNVTAKEFLVGYGTKNNLQIYGGGTVVIPEWENRPCYLPVYIGGRKNVGTAYIFWDPATKNMRLSASYESGNTAPFRFRIMYR